MQRLSGVKTLCGIRVQLADALQSSDDSLKRLSQLLGNFGELILAQLRQEVLGDSALYVPVRIVFAVDLFEEALPGTGSTDSCRIEIPHDLKIRLGVLF